MESIIEGTRYTCTKLMHKIFEERLKETIKKRTALIYDDFVESARKTSFGDLNKNANRLASYILCHLHNINAKPNRDGDYIIAVCMTTNEYVVTTLLAIWKVGAAYLPIEPKFPRDRITHIVGEAKPVLVIYDRYEDLSVFENAHFISFDELMSISAGCEVQNIHTQNSFSRGDDDTAIILYTSGSTGTPKGVRLPHTAVFNKLRWLQQTFPYSETEEVCVLNSALTNVDSVAELWCPLLNEVAVLVLPEEVTKDPSQLTMALEEHKIERIVLVPTLLTSLLLYLPLQNQSNLLSNLKTWICGGETLTTALTQEFFNYYSDGEHVLCNFYGSTEVMGDVTYYVCQNMEQLEGLTKVPIGYPLDNTVIFILDDNLKAVKPGEIGEIFVAGLNLAKGYVNGREKNKFIFNKFTDNPKFDRLHQTGDFGTIIKEGCIQYEGRKDSQIKVRGNRVDLTEVETIVRSVDDVEKGIVLCYHVGKSDQAILAFVTLKVRKSDSDNKERFRIENILKTKLIDFQVPHVVIIEVVPLLANGKIDRQKLLKIYESSSNSSAAKFDYTGVPEDQLQMAQDVFETIGKVIGRSTRATISIKSNFYELGGDSLNSVFTVTQLRNKGYLINVTDFITAESLCDVLNKISKDGKEHTAVEDPWHLQVIPLSMFHKDETIRIITASFYEKSDLGQYLKPHIDRSDFKDMVEQIWDYALKQGLSYAVAESGNDIVGFALNFDGADDPQISLSWNMMIALDFLEELEGPIK